LPPAEIPAAESLLLNLEIRQSPDGPEAAAAAPRRAIDPMILKRRRLGPPRRLTGRERRWLNPNKGFFKVLERQVDLFVSRFVYPHMLGVWNPYRWVLSKRFGLSEISLSPIGWPRDVPRLKVLLVSDIHCGIFLDAGILSDIVVSLMEVRPDLVAVAGDVVTGRAGDLDGLLDCLKPFSRAPLGAWYCFGNHDYFGGDAEEIRARLGTIGIATLKNDAVVVKHGAGRFVLGGLDDRILGKPSWLDLLAKHGPPHLLLAHHPDFFYQAEAQEVPLTLSGHTHGGQIRFPKGPPLIRQSEFCLDEGAYTYNASLLVVSRGLGSVGLPWRYGAEPEAVLIEITPPGQD
jgi:predicted MPP superfamily phosphohydrolase